jgi:putative transposase
MSRDTTVIPFRHPEAIDDPLTEVAREDARRMLAQGNYSPLSADQAAVRAGMGVARASQMAASALRPARRPVATMEQRSA